jgi:hypothetical protein
VLDVASLLELADFTCVHCGQPGADDFGLRDELEAALTPVTPLRPGGGVQRMERYGIGRVDLAGLAQFRPVHARCLPGQRCGDCQGSGRAGGERCGRCRGTGLFNLLRSVC